MKNLLVVLSLLIITSVSAQVKTPAPSPFQKLEQKVGLTAVTLEYSRPGMKGRTIFGGLVPFNKVWRTGANANTKITFSTDVTIGGTALKAGSYAIYTKPTSDSWEVIFYSDATNWGLPQEWDDTKVAATVKVNTFVMPMSIETFTMTFDDLSNDSANMGILWENTYVAVTIEVPTDTMVMATIDASLSGPTANDYYASAVYYLQEGKDLGKALEWIDKAISMREKPAYWYFRQKSLIHAKSGDKKSAITAAKTSLDLATEAGNDDYVTMNTNSLKEWGGM